MKKYYLLMFFFFGFEATQAQDTLIPDPFFEQNLISSGYDNILDGKVLTANISGITSIDISGGASDLTGIQDFVSLQSLTCVENPLTSLNVSGLTNLQTLICAGNHLTNLNVSGLTNLQTLNCGGNQLTNLNVSGLTNLQRLRCGGNQLSELDLRGLTNLYDLQSSSNPNLSCVSVTNFDLLAILDSDSDSFTRFSLDCSIPPVYTLIPDSNFEQVLIDNGFDNILDGRVLTENISVVTELSFGGSNIGDLTGIQDFVALQYLECSGTQLTNLNVSGLHNLQTLYCPNNQLTNLNVSGLTNLQSLRCGGNQLTNLNVNGATSLQELDCTYNQLSELDLRGLTNLFNLQIFSNPNLSCVSVANFDLLAVSNYDSFTRFSLDCSIPPVYTLIPDSNFEQVLIDNGLDNILDGRVITENISFTTVLYINYQNISDLTGIQDFVALQYLECSGNQLTNLNVSGLHNLQTLYCDNNQLTNLNLSALTALQNLNCINNPSLSCIQVDNIAAATANSNWVKDATASYSLNCNQSYTAIPDENFEQALFDQGIDTVNGDNRVLTSAISGIYGLNIENKNIADLTGIQGFTSLQGLYCDNNLLTSLDLSGLSNLKYLSCRSNQITTLNLSGLTLLESIDCSSNQIGSLNLNGFSFLKDLNSSNNILTNLIVDGLTSLQSLLCNNNLLENLNLNGLTSLQVLWCNNNQLQSLTITNCANLEDLHCENNVLTSLNLNSLTNLKYLICSNNQLISLELNGLGNLISINCSNNQLPNINLSGLNGLLYLYCTNNQLTSLNLNGLTSLISVGCSVNLITTISGLSNNLQVLDCSFNLLPNLNLSGFTNLVNLFCNNNSLESLDISGCTNLSSMLCTNNPNLYCITVTNPTSAYANSNWNKDTTAGYSITSSCFGPVTVNYCRTETPSPLTSNVNSPVGITLKWYTVASRGTASLIAPTPSTTTVGTRNYYVSQIIDGIEGSRVTITVIVNALPTTPTALVLTNDAAVLPATPTTAITAVGIYVGSGVPLKLTATAAAATSYIWTLPAGVTLADGTTTGVVTTPENTINVLISASADKYSAVLAVKSLNLIRCASLSRTLTLTRAPAVAPGSLRMNNGINTTAITTFAPYMGTTRILRLSAAVSATATSYVWELPTGVTRVTSLTDSTIIASTESTLPEIFVTFTGVTSSNTFNYNTTATVPVSTNVLRIGVFGKNGTGLSSTNNTALTFSSPLFTPNNTSTARLLTLTAIRPAAPAALKLTNAAAVAPATAATAIVDISRFIGTNTELTLTATASLLASEYVWDLPTGTNITEGAVTTVSRSIKVNFSNVSAGAATYYLGVFAKNGINLSTRDNSLLVPAVPVTSANARVVRVAAVIANVPASLISRNNGGVSTTNISSFIGTSTPLTLTTAVVSNVLSYTYTVPAGVDIIEDSVGVSTTSSTSFTTTLTTITVNYQNVASGVASIPVAVRANNFVGSSANRPLNLTAAAPATPTVTGVLAICSTAATNVLYTIPTLAVGATSYFITAPAGATVNGGTDNAAILAVLESTFTINYPSGFIANATTSKRAIIIQSKNGFGVNVVSRTLNLTNVGAVCPAPPVAPVTVFNVTPNGSVSYTINGTVGSPTLTLTRGTTYTFNISSVGHPFNINTINTTGTASQYNDGITNNNITSGTLTFVVDASAPSTLYYNCAFHTNQGGVINVIDAPARFSSASVANGFKVIAYPNPSSSEFTIETSAKGAINVKVYDMQGRLVEKADTNKVGSRLAAGTYNVIVNQGTNNKSVRVIKK